MLDLILASSYIDSVQVFRIRLLVQCSPFIMLCLGSIGMDHVISEPCYKGAILQRKYRKMTIFPKLPLYNSMVKHMGATT